ncbi:MAG: type II secretion system inner membrane protein GspF [Bdellovibrio sp.]|nr:type II secretion system inner membrane protein GspF [Bdellovibrio sp.]
MAPLFDYKAYSLDGKSQKGFIEAESSKLARQKIKKMGLTVVEISEKTAASKKEGIHSLPFFGGGVSGAEITLLTRQFASLIKANIPLVEALTALIDQSEKPTLKIILSQIRQDVNEGSGLAKAFAKHSKVFDTIYINMIEAGESSGTLGLVLLRLADLKEAQMRLRGKVISGLTYPALMLCVSLFLLIAIFTFVIPKIAKIFESMNKPLPAMTKVLISISDVVVGWWYLFAIGIFVFIWMFRSWSKSPAGRPKWDKFKLKLPLFGSLLRMVAITRFAKTMSTLLGSGVPILSAMNIAKNLVNNIPIAEAISVARENITEGQSIAEPLRKSGEFPPMVIHMIAIGEKTGELPQMLESVSNTYEEQVNAIINRMTTLIEPIMLIVMGGVVGFIVLSIFVPLLDMSNLDVKR